MNFKSILCLLGGMESELNVLHTSVALAKVYGAKIRFLHISSDVDAYAGLYGEGVLTVASVMEAIERENQTRLKSAKAHVVAYTTQHHIPLDVPHEPTHHASAKFVHVTGVADDIIAYEGRMSDIIIIGRGGSGEPDAVYDANVGAALFNTGRPVILLPSRGAISPSPEYRTIVLAWNGSMESARAMYNAFPLLERAEKVYVLQVQASGAKHDLEAESALMNYLQAHGVQPTPIVVAQGRNSPAESLLMRAKELKADMLVMGAYGHSRLREMVLGGITRHMLEKADIPLLLSH